MVGAEVVRGHGPLRREHYQNQENAEDSAQSVLRQGHVGGSQIGPAVIFECTGNSCLSRLSLWLAQSWAVID